MDGSLGSSTAKMFDPLRRTTPKNTGVYVTEPDDDAGELDHGGRTRPGSSVAVHAIGDQANARAPRPVRGRRGGANGPRDRRFRIEHAQHLRPADYPRFKQLGVVASMQPFHVADDGRWAVGRIGEKRCASSYAFRSLVDAGAVLAFGSDWPVAPLDPFVGLDAAVTRRTLDGKNPGGWFPEQRVTVAEAVAAYTLGSAYAAHQEADRGTLAAGKLADFVVLSQDVFDATDAEKLGVTKAAMTVVGGKVVFERK